MTLSRAAFVLVSFACTATVTGPVQAGLNGGFRSWREVSDDRQYVLVMVSNEPLEKDASPDDLEEHELREIRDIRATYSASGLYRNDGSTTPLWTINYHGKYHDYFFAPDGRHLVIADDSWYHGYSEHVATFYADGQQLARYGVSDLMWLTPWKVPQCAWSEFDPVAMTYSVASDQGHRFVFDVRTGDVIQRSSRWPLIGLTMLGVMLTAVFLLVVLMRRRTP